MTQETTPVTLNLFQPIHFVGVGGVGMSALAKVLHSLGYMVTGSDCQSGPYLKALRLMGVSVWESHAAENVPENALIVASTAIASDNPELVLAAEKHYPVIHRSALLNAIMDAHQTSIGLLGTHGKTTMTGLLGLMLVKAGLDPTILAGGKIPPLKTNAKASTKPVDQALCVAEVDESDGSMVIYHPTYSVIANVEFDHPDHYPKGLASVMDGFERWLNGLTSAQTVLFNRTCPNTNTLFSQLSTSSAAQKPRALGIFLSDEAFNQGQPVPNGHYLVRHPHLNPVTGCYQGVLYWQAEEASPHDQPMIVARLTPTLPGEHVMWNAAFCAALAHQIGADRESIESEIRDFNGMGRRFERLGELNGALIIDDYAHHPTEVRATLAAARQWMTVQESPQSPQGRLLAVFQPHRYSRLQALWDDFANSFTDADAVVVLDVFSAGEAPIEGVSAADFALAITSSPAMYWSSQSDWATATQQLTHWVKPNDCVVMLGAGSISSWAHQVVSGASA